MPSSEFLLEIGTEEIPDWMIEPALDHLRRLLEEGLEKLRLTSDGAVPIETHATPRRLVAFCPDLPDRQPDTEQLLQGPPKAAPPQAAAAFARKMGTSPANLTVVATPKGEYWAFRRKQEGKPTAELLKAALPEVILGIYFPRTMYWAGKNGPRFIRPIRSLLALYAGRVVRFSIAGVTSGRYTFGHRSLGRARLKVTDFEQYRKVLGQNFVILKASDRQEKILREAGALLAQEQQGPGAQVPQGEPWSRGLRLRSDPELLNTLVYLTEFPTAALGSFDPSYLALPEEVLVTVMQHHQKYLPVLGPDGRLAPRFVFVMNLDGDASGAIRHGNERVLRARFNDACFFWETDQKLPLRDRLPLLEHLTFQSQLGSYRQKTERNMTLARALAGRLGADIEAAVRAAELAKCDLTTELVKEFTELEGIIGGLYARQQGEPEKVARAIYEHYRPRSMEEQSPATDEGAVVSLADKLDTLAGCFSIGLKPSGSSDPFALRRAAQGVVKILADRDCRVGLTELIQDALALQASQDTAVALELKKFFLERLMYYLREVRGFAYDEVNAVLAVGADDVPDTVARCTAVARVRKTENFEPLAIAFKRINNILTKAGGWHQFSSDPEEGLFEQDAERELFQAAQRIHSQIRKQAQQEFLRAPDYENELHTTAQLRPLTDAFFAKVLVMAEDDRLRENRLRLLAWMLRHFRGVADFSKIAVTREGEPRTS